MCQQGRVRVWTSTVSRVSDYWNGNLALFDFLSALDVQGVGQAGWSDASGASHRARLDFFCPFVVQPPLLCSTQAAGQKIDLRFPAHVTSRKRSIELSPISRRKFIQRLLPGHDAGAFTDGVGREGFWRADENRRVGEPHPPRRAALTQFRALVACLRFVRSALFGPG